MPWETKKTSFLFSDFLSAGKVDVHLFSIPDDYWLRDETEECVIRVFGPRGLRAFCFFANGSLLVPVLVVRVP